MPSKAIIWNGKEYGSITSAALELGMSRSTLRDWITAGYTCSEDAMPHSCNRRAVEWNGKTYPSVQDMADDLGIPYQTAYSRIAKGHTSDDSGIGSGAHMRRAVEWNGEHFESVTEASQALGISFKALYARILKGHKSDDDLIYQRKHRPSKQSRSLPKIRIDRRENGRPVEWNGIEYRSIADAARQNRLSYKAMRYRIYSGFRSDAELLRKTRQHQPYEGLRLSLQAGLYSNREDYIVCQIEYKEDREYAERIINVDGLMFIHDAW